MKQDKIRELVAMGQLENAIDTLINEGYEAAKQLQTRFIEAQNLSIMGQLSYQNESIIRSQIAHSLLLLLDSANKGWISPATASLTDTKVAEPIMLRVKTFSSSEKAHIEQLLKDDKTEVALHFCKDFGNTFIFLMGSYREIKRNAKLCLITEAQEKESLGGINAAIRDLLG